MIYVWKFLEGLVPDVGLEINNHIRKGRLCYIKRTEATTQRMKTVAHNSFTKYGARPFSAGPKAIQELFGVTMDSFKHQLDRWLNTLLDEPPTPGYPNIVPNTRIPQHCPQHQDTPTLHPIPGYPNTAPNSLTDRRNNQDAKLPGHSGDIP